jgi:hypothetical protein
MALIGVHVPGETPLTDQDLQGRSVRSSPVLRGKCIPHVSHSRLTFPSSSLAVISAYVSWQSQRYRV